MFFFIQRGTGPDVFLLHHFCGLCEQSKQKVLTQLPSRFLVLLDMFPGLVDRLSALTVPTIWALTCDLLKPEP